MPEIEPGDPSIRALGGLHLWHAPMSSCSQRVRIVLAEMGQSYESHLVALDKDEHASAAYQAIHPGGLVPALSDDGRLFIESIDIIAHLAAHEADLAGSGDPTLLQMADEAQADLKLCTHEFLFRSRPQPSAERAEAFQKTHQNATLRQFKRDMANGFAPERLDAAVRRIDTGFRHLDELLSDGRTYLTGEVFTIDDIAWMPNVHRFDLMGWPFGRTPHLSGWFDLVSQRDSYQTALVAWEPEGTAEKFAAYTEKRRAEGTDIRAFGGLGE